MKKLNIFSFIPHIHIGMRTVKTVIAVFLSLCLAYIRGGFANPLYIGFAAILGIQQTVESTKTAGANRVVATMIGGFWGIVIFLLNLYVFPNLHIILKYVIISLGLIPLIYTTLYFKRASGVTTGSVVYLIITVSPPGRMTAFQFLFNRIFDTLCGFAIAFPINHIKLPGQEELAEKIEYKNNRKQVDKTGHNLGEQDGDTK